jgi:hypothetical protein
MGSEGTSWGNFLCQSSHPMVAFFHLAFKGAALFTYLFRGWLGLDFVTTFIVCVLLLAADFWTVKNVSGRLLVRLRWWSRVRDDDTTEWVFEGAPDGGASVRPVDSRIFWTGLFVFPAVWAVLGVLALLTLSLDWSVVCAVGLGLQGANVYGYVRCSGEAQQQLRSAASAGAMSAISRGTTAIFAASGVNTAAADVAGNAAGASGANFVGSLIGSAFGPGGTPTAGAPSSSPLGATAPTLAPQASAAVNTAVGPKIVRKTAGGGGRKGPGSAGFTGRVDGLDDDATAAANPFAAVADGRSPSSSSHRASAAEANPFLDASERVV